MPSDNILKYGILQCRDLVELYYGARMVATIVEHSFAPSTTPYQILLQDTRRIRYEVSLGTANYSVTENMFIGSPTAIQNGTALSFVVNYYWQLLVVRDFRTDFDAVVLPLMVSDPQGVVTVGVRETILTPAPVDEVPLG